MDKRMSAPYMARFNEVCVSVLKLIRPLVSKISTNDLALSVIPIIIIVIIIINAFVVIRCCMRLYCIVCNLMRDVRRSGFIMERIVVTHTQTPNTQRL